MIDTPPDRTDWDRANLALELLASAPPGLGGIVIRARVGPVRDRFLAQVRKLFPEARDCHPQTPDDVLYGGLDFAQTLATGSKVMSDGLLSGAPKVLLLKMAERATPSFTARLCQALDDGKISHLFAMDEGIEDETVPTALGDRLAFQVRLDDLRLGDCKAEPKPKGTRAAHVPKELKRELIILSAKLGITSLRAALFVNRATQAIAAANNRETATLEDATLAAELVLAPRALFLPMEPPQEDQSEDAPAPDETQSQETDTEGNSATPPDEILLDAARAAIPKDLLAQLAAGTANRQTSSGAAAQGALRTGNRRGRPLPSRRGKPNGQARIDLIATLRAAAPWQKLRSKTSDRTGLHLRASDIHLKRAQIRSDRLLTFCVDASGSAALNRLAEAKGAIEVLLAQAYALRDHVALVAYRRETAELLLAPTRSLVQTKRQLAALPGGGATPLAIGLKAALEVAQSARLKGFAPALAVLADGRANIDLSGNADRPQAFEDAKSIASLIKSQRLPAVLIDMSKRPSAQLGEIAALMGASYVPLPFGDAKSLSANIENSLERAS